MAHTLLLVLYLTKLNFQESQMILPLSRWATRTTEGLKATTSTDTTPTTLTKTIETTMTIKMMMVASEIMVTMATVTMAIIEMRDKMIITVRIDNNQRIVRLGIHKTSLTKTSTTVVATITT